MFFVDLRTAKVVWTIIVCVGALALVYLLRKPIFLLVFSVFFAYLILPLVVFVERRLPRRFARPLAIALVYVALLLAVVAIGVGIGPRLTDDVTVLARKAPDMAQQVASGRFIGTILLKRGWDTSRVAQVEGAVRSHAGQIIDYVQGAVGTAARWLVGAWVIVLVPVFAFFILKDGDRAHQVVDELIEEPQRRQLWRDIGQDLSLLLGRYVRALLALSMITFVAWSVVFLVAGVPYSVGLAAIGGVLELLPIVGPLTAGVVVVTVALFSGYAHPWLLVAFWLAWRAIQDYVTSPLVMRHGVEMHPAVVIFGVIAGGEIGGPVGMFLSVPVIAALRILWRRIRSAPAPQEGPA
jgi:predicted PurR-regulated permease PerM